MTTPLTTWTCDTCSETIEGPNRGLVVWRTDRDAGLVGQAHDFRIVHKTGVGNVQEGCDPTSAAGFTSSLDISDLVGADGLAHLLSLLDAGPLTGGDHQRVKDFPGFVDLIRRLQTPYYEEARPRLLHDTETRDQLDGANEYYPYTSDVLQRVASGKL